MADSREHKGAEKGGARDEVDPELIALRVPRAGVGPVLLASVVGLVAFVLWTLAPDLAYWMGAKTPQRLDRAAGDLPDNAYVTLEAPPDRGRALRLRGRQDVGRRVAPVQGSSGRLWLALEGDANLAKNAYEEVYTGRLRALDDLSWSDDLREHVSRLPPEPHFVSLASLPPPGQAMKDQLGDEVSVGPETPLEVEERVPNSARVTVIKTDTVKDEGAARLALTAALGQAAPAPVETTEGSWVYELEADPAALRARFTEAKFYAGIVEPRFALHRATRADVSVDDTQKTVRVGEAQIRLAAVEHAAVYVAPRIPAGAKMLVTGETPDEYWYVPVLYALLGLLAVLMIWAFVRTLRPYKGLPGA